MTSPRGASLAILAALLVVAGVAFGGAPQRVVLQGASEQDPVVARLGLEFAAMGLDVVFRKSSDVPAQALAEELGASAVARVAAEPPAVLLWVDPRQSPGPPLVVDGTRDPSLLALRATELLRGSLVPVEVHPVEPPSPRAPPVRTLEPPRAARPPSRPSGRERTLGVFAGPALVTSPGGVPATGNVWLGLDVAIAPPFRFEVMGLLPTVPATLTEREGEAQLQLGAFGGGFGVVATRPDSPWFGHAGLGLAALIAVFAGEASPPRTGQTGAQFIALPHLRLSGGVRVAPALAFRADFLAGLAAPSPILRFGTREVATFGEPLCLAALSVEVFP